MGEDYKQALDYILGRERFGIRLGLKNISGLMKSLGNPHNSFKSVHVAGTNGKGSVCAFISSILQKAGYKVGLYTSPHLFDFKERIQVNGEEISEETVVRLLDKIKPFIKDHTFFEVITAIAFLYFSEQEVDIAIIEVGLGGRLDATNVITPLVSVITNISEEHTHYLGEKLDQIAFEKAGIIKSGIPVVSAAAGISLKVIQQVCSENNSELHIAKPRHLETSLKGDFQEENASVALKVIDLLEGFKINDNAIKDGLHSAQWPGRMQFISKKLLLDCAHNPAGAAALAKELRKLSYNKIVLVLGIMGDKDIPSICKHLEQFADEIIVTKPKIDRAAEPEEISRHLAKSHIIEPDVCKAIERANACCRNGLVVVAGSIYLIGEAFSCLGLKPFGENVGFVK